MAKTVNKGLGRGLASLMGFNDIDDIALKTGSENTSVSGKTADGVVNLALLDIDPNREQPRKNFDEEALNELAESIRTYGVIQPIVVTPVGKRFMIIAGERRFQGKPHCGKNGNPGNNSQLHPAGNKGNKPY